MEEQRHLEDGSQVRPNVQARLLLQLGDPSGSLRGFGLGRSASPPAHRCRRSDARGRPAVWSMVRRSGSSRCSGGRLTTPPHPSSGQLAILVMVAGHVNGVRCSCCPAVNAANSTDMATPPRTERMEPSDYREPDGILQKIDGQRKRFPRRIFISRTGQKVGRLRYVRAGRDRRRSRRSDGHRRGGHPPQSTRRWFLCGHPTLRTATVCCCLVLSKTLLMPTTERALCPDVNVSIATGNGRFSAVD